MPVYLMESETEGERIRQKTKKDVTLEHLNIAGLKKGMKAIDIGCASGEVTRTMAEITDNVVGFDCSVNRIEQAIQIDSKLGINNIKYVVGNAYKTRLEDNYYDFVWARFLFEYLGKKPLPVLQELKRITKPGGKVVVVDIDGNCVFHYPIDTELEKAIQETVLIANKITGWDPYVGRKLYNFFYQTGFKDIKVDILPYNQVIGEPSPEVYKLWEMKINTVKNAMKLLVPNMNEKYKNLPEEFLNQIKIMIKLSLSTFKFIIIIITT